MREPIPIWQALVRNGALAVLEYKRWGAYLASMEGKALEVIVRKPVRIRSNKENRYYHGVVVPLIAEYCGYTAADHDAVHEAITTKFLPLHGPHNTLKVRMSTTELSTAEFEVFLEAVRVWAAQDLGITIPLPNEVLEDPRQNR